MDDLDEDLLLVTLFEEQMVCFADVNTVNTFGISSQKVYGIPNNYIGNFLAIPNQKPNQVGEIRLVPINPQSHPGVFFLIDSNVEHCAMFQGGRAEDPPKIFKDSFEGNCCNKERLVRAKRSHQEY